MSTFNFKDAPPHILRKFNKHGSTKRGSRIFRTMVSTRDMLRRKVKKFHDELCATQKCVENICPHNVKWLVTELIYSDQERTILGVKCIKCDKSFEEFNYKG